MDKLKLGLLIDNIYQPSWVYNIIERINGGSYANIVLVIYSESEASQKSWIQKLRDRFNLYDFYRKVEERNLKSTSKIFLLKDISPLLISAEQIRIKNSDTAAGSINTSAIAEQKIDVVLKFGNSTIQEEVVKIARLGIWSYSHHDKNEFSGEPVGFWEFYHQKKVIGSSLQMQGAKGKEEKILFRSWSAISRIHRKNLEGFYLKTSLFIERKLKELYELGEEDFLKRIEADNEQLNADTRKVYKSPRNDQFLKVILRNIISSIKYRIRTRFYFDQWILLYSFDDTVNFSMEINKYHRLIPPADRFWADPFVVYKDEKYFVFFEELFYKNEGEKGHLSVMEITRNGVITAPQIILEKPYHLSYPFIFEYKNTFYMIPESSADSTIQLYECKEFPYKWEFKMNLMENIKAVDTTIHFTNNKWWLFANVSELPGVSNSEELFLFSADDLFSTNWKSHPGNPIVSDIRSSRPAGRIFTYKEKLYRPSQDCSVAYGYSILLNEITALTDEKYEEIIIAGILPDWAEDVKATHTLSFDHGLTVIDAQIRRKKLV